jgi:hypothetical protein
VYVFEDSIIKPTKHYLENGGRENGTILEGVTCSKYTYTWMKLSQWNPLLLLIYANEKYNKTIF